MIALIPWQTFQMRILKTAEQAFVYETETQWIFFASVGPIIVKSIVDKSEDAARNAAFIDRIISNINIIKLISYDEQMSLNFEVMQR